MNLLPASLRKRWEDRPPVVPVVRMAGPIMAQSSPLRPALSLSTVAGQLEKAFTMKRAPAVAISINSPGGSPVQSRLIFQRIRDLAKEHGKKVHVFVEDAAASGGYMIACAGDDITADPSSIVGSIGVVSAGFGFVDAIDKLGVERRVVTAGENKAILDPFQPVKEDEVQRLRDLQQEVHGVFIDLVKQARGERLGDHPEMFTGAFWTGLKGEELGLVDAVGDLRGSLRARYGDKVKIRVIEVRKGLFGRGRGFGLSNTLAHAPDRLAGAGVRAMVDAAEERALWGRLGL